MSISRDEAAQKLLEAIGVGAPTKILCNLPEHLQTVEVLRALICADAAGYRRRACEAGAVALASVRLSSSRTQ